MRDVRPGSAAWTARLLTAAFFALVLVVEWGSHNLAFAHAGSESEAVAMGVKEIPHDDPCRSIVCCQGRKGDTIPPASTHDRLPYFTEYGQLPHLSLAALSIREAKIPRESSGSHWRPIDPLFQPPEDLRIVNT